MPVSASSAALRDVPAPRNEPVKAYAPRSAERAELEAGLAAMARERLDIPLVIGGREVRSGRTAQAVMPCDHRHVLGDWHRAEPRHVRAAVAAAMRARREWSAWPWEDRAAVFLKAAELLAGRRRAVVNAATMLGQGKTVAQAEIDAACELVDFWRFNVAYAAELYAEQPENGPGAWNALDYRPIEGFVYAVTPFNFTAIAGNLPTAPAIMGAVSIWKPAASAVVSAHYVMQTLLEAGLPPGVINFVPGDAQMISDALLGSADLGGIHFTGSTAVFQRLWQTTGANIARYRSYPRLVGETGGKDFIVAHASADVEALAVAIVRGGFEYQGKCSAASRVYVPQSIWTAVRDRVLALVDDLRMGDVRDFRTFVGAVIDRAAFEKVTGYIALARRSAKILRGGGSDAKKGYFIEPTVVEVASPTHRLMTEEIFGPVVAFYVYPDRAWTSILRTIDRSSPYALTGAVFARDRGAIRQAAGALRDAAGNFYINDKPTGAVVGQQPFGGGRASGTNDKAGSRLNLVRWVSARTIKETFVPPDDYRYPSMAAR